MSIYATLSREELTEVIDRIEKTALEEGVGIKDQKGSAPLEFVRAWLWREIKVLNDKDEASSTVEGVATTPEGRTVIHVIKEAVPLNSAELLPIARWLDELVELRAEKAKWQKVTEFANRHGFGKEER